MNRKQIEFYKFKNETVSRYDRLYYDFLREAVVSNECITEGFAELPAVKETIDEYAKAYHITGAGFATDDIDNTVQIRPDVVYRCARLMYCIFEKSPLRRSKRVSNKCAISSYGLKHVLERWLDRLSDHTVAKPFDSADSSYVSNGEAIMACLVLRDQFEDWPSSAVWFSIKNNGTPNLYNIRFNSNFRNFLHTDHDFFDDKNFDFGYVGGEKVAYPRFNEKTFMRKLYHPSCYGARLGKHM